MPALIASDEHFAFTPWHTQLLKTLWAFEYLVQFSLLASYLDRYYPDWRDDTDSDSFREQGPASGFDGMTRKEAYQILGVEPGVSEQEIHQAWRRLIKKVHPDSGGSAFLTAKINAAKDILLD